MKFIKNKLFTTICVLGLCLCMFVGVNCHQKNKKDKDKVEILTCTAYSKVDLTKNNGLVEFNNSEDNKGVYLKYVFLEENKRIIKETNFMMPGEGVEIDFNYVVKYSNKVYVEVILKEFDDLNERCVARYSLDII